MVLCGSILVYQQTWQYTSSISPRNEKQKAHEFEIVIKIYCVQYLQECSKRSATFVLSLWSCESFVFNCKGAYWTERAGLHLWSEGDKDGYVRQQRSYSSSLYPDVLGWRWCGFHIWFVFIITVILNFLLSHCCITKKHWTLQIPSILIP